MEGQARLIKNVTAVASVVLTTATARQTTATGIRRYLRVTPEEPQSVVWVVPGDVVQYSIESNTRWNIV